MTGALDETVLRHWLVDYLVTNIGCSPDEIDFDASMHDLGVGSRDAVVLSGELSELLGRTVSPWSSGSTRRSMRWRGFSPGRNPNPRLSSGDRRSTVDGRADRRHRPGMPLPG